MPQDDKSRTLLTSARHCWIAIPASKTLVTLLFKIPLLCVRVEKCDGREVGLTSPRPRQIRQPPTVERAHSPIIIAT